MAPILRVVAASLPLLKGPYEAFGAWVDGRPCGFGLSRHHVVSSRAVVVSLTTSAVDAGQDGSLGGPGKLEIDTTARLIAAMSDLAATQGVVSLGTAIPDDSPFAPVFERSGFRAVVREHSYTRAPRPAPEPSQIPCMRLQQPADAWDIFQLYRAITPAAVQQAEGLTADDWDFSPGDRGLLGRSGGAKECHVISGEHGLDGWIDIRTDPDGAHRFELMVHPRARCVIGPIVSFALWRLSHYPVAPTRVLVRDSEVLVAAGLKEAGFEPDGVNRRMVKHLAVRLSAEVPSAALDQATS